MERVVIAASSKRWLVLLLGASCFVVVGVLLVVSARGPLVGWLNIVFFGGCGIVFALQAFDRRPRIVIDDRGIFDRTLRVGTIDWADIRRVSLKRSQGQAFICLDLADPPKYTQRLSPLLRRIVQLNRKLGFTDLSLNLVGTTVSPERVEELLTKELALRANPAAV